MVGGGEKECRWRNIRYRGAEESKSDRAKTSEEKWAVANFDVDHHSKQLLPFGEIFLAGVETFAALALRAFSR
jgi:hypothetical protein